MLWVFLALGCVPGCAPSAKTVALVSVGNTGCPAEELAVFNYDRENKSWRAGCGDNLYVCSDIRGATECQVQQAHTVEPGLNERVKLLLTLPKAKRNTFVEQDILKPSWDEFSVRVQTVAKLSNEQLEEIPDLQQLYTGFSGEFNELLKACRGANSVYKIRSNGVGSGFLSGSSDRCAKAGLLESPELETLKGVPNADYYLATDVNGIQPLAPPMPPVESSSPDESAPGSASDSASDSDSDSDSAPESVPAADAVSTSEAHGEELESATSPRQDSEVAESNLDEALVRAWINEASKDILTCTATTQAAVLVEVDTDGKATVKLRGELAGSAEERCIADALGEKSFEGGPGRVVHLVKQE